MAMRVCASCSRLLATDACPEDGGDAVAVEQLPEGARIGPYEIIETIGKGGMGQVYEAVHTDLGRRVAIKFLRDELGDDELPGRFLREARAVSRIDHDNVIRVYDYGDGSAGAVYFVMEMLDGETLWDLNRRRGRLDPALCHHVYDQIMAALEAAHRRQVIHRDLKPTNVFLVDRGKSPFVKLLDFGLARLLGDRAGPRLTIDGTIMGTPEYMSPEQIEGKPADARADIYAIGVMLYESLTGSVPFPAAGLSFPALAGKVLGEAPVPPSQRAPVSSGLERVILRALAKDPEARFESVAAMRAALSAAFDEPDFDSSLTIPAPASEPTPAAAPRRRPMMLAVAVAILAAAIAASAAIAAASGASAALLVRALEGSPALRLEAAARIAELRLFESAAAIRGVLDRSGETLRVQLAAELSRLGDHSGIGLLERGLASGDRRIVLTCAEALVSHPSLGAAAIAALEQIAGDTPAGRESWRRANAALHRAGREAAGRALVAELTRGDADRAVAAAAVLAPADSTAADYLERVVADPDFAARPAAALALARLGREPALGYVEAGLAGDDREKIAALAVAVRLAKRGGERHAARVAPLADSSSPEVSAAARTALLAF